MPRQYVRSIKQPLPQYPSVRRMLEQHIGCREIGGRGWAIYWSEGGSELTLYPGDEGPQEASSIDEMLEWIGGDQPCEMTPGTLEWLRDICTPEQRAAITHAIYDGGDIC